MIIWKHGMSHSIYRNEILLQVFKLHLFFLAASSNLVLPVKIREQNPSEAVDEVLMVVPLLLKTRPSLPHLVSSHQALFCLSTRRTWSFFRFSLLRSHMCLPLAIAVKTDFQSTVTGVAIWIYFMPSPLFLEGDCQNWHMIFPLLLHLSCFI